MATLNLTPDEFADVALLYLADKAVNPEKVSKGNERFTKFMKKNSQQFKGKLVKYYLETDPEIRREYKLIKKAFAGEGRNRLDTIRIGPEKTIKGIRTEKKKSKGLIKKIIKKLLTKKEEMGISSEELDLLLEFIEED